MKNRRFPYGALRVSQRYLLGFPMIRGEQLRIRSNALLVAHRWRKGKR